MTTKNFFRILLRNSANERDEGGQRKGSGRCSEASRRSTVPYNPARVQGLRPILACKLVNEEIDKSKSLDEIFCPESEYGYQLAGRECKDGRPSRFKPSVPLSVRRWRPVI